ncbi:MAG TPA: hypothetical protein VHY30_00660 [Verrucomicrobiae bacterium]|jgi:hypothetical protein|nr:hypothetical protein [Verrucomicrobiae bacterium]
MGTLFFICIIGFGIFWFGAIIIWILKIRPYLERHSQKTGFLLFQSSLLKDHHLALEIARKQGSKPWFLKTFSVFAIVGIVFFLCGLVAVTLGGILGR